MDQKRAEAIRKKLFSSGGWGLVGRDYSEAEYQEIMKFWVKLPGNTSFYNAVTRMSQGEHLK